MVPDVVPKNARYDLVNVSGFGQVPCAHPSFLGDEVRRHQRSKVRVVLIEVQRSNVLCSPRVCEFCVQRFGLKRKTLLAVDKNSKVIRVKGKFYSMVHEEKIGRFGTRVPNFCQAPVEHACEKVFEGLGSESPVVSSFDVVNAWWKIFDYKPRIGDVNVESEF